VKPPPTEPKAPDILGYVLVCAVCVVAVLLLDLRRPETFQGGVWGLAFVELCICGAYFLLILAAKGNYKSAMEAYALWKRAQPATPVLPDPHNIYNIHGTISLRTKDGGWMDIGEGTATFTIKPPRAPAPPLPTYDGIRRVRRAVYNGSVTEADAEVVRRFEAQGYTRVEYAEYARFEATKPIDAEIASYNPRAGERALYFVRIVTPQKQTPPTG
jgi:hypothetical protein